MQWYRAKYAENYPERADPKEASLLLREPHFRTRKETKCPCLVLAQFQLTMSDSGKLLPVTAIKTMKLYSHFERVDNELRAKGFKDGDSLTLEALQNYDHMNYRGQEGVRVCIGQC